MASADEEMYAPQDPLDEFLAQSISKYVIFSKLSTFANDLRVPRREMERIMAPNVFQQDQRVKEILYYWQQKKENYTVQKFVDDLKKWQKQQYVDKDVLSYVQSRIKPPGKTEEAGATAAAIPTAVTKLTGNEVLTDGMLLNLAMKFSQELMVHILAGQGLGMDVHVVKPSLHNNRDINMAMHDLLQKWRVSQPNAKVAYANLYHALEKVGMSDFIGVLKSGSF